jgi:hypothetical protein
MGRAADLFFALGGGIDFMRVFADRLYGVPPEQIVGSSGKLNFELRDGKPVLMKMPELNFNDDKAGKPVGIQMHIDRRPIAAFGNSDGDLQMLVREQVKANPVSRGRRLTLGGRSMLLMQVELLDPGFQSRRLDVEKRRRTGGSTNAPIALLERL